ncbi:hypothetical protein GCM10010174_71140 [Kutzneria viridogrisea]
MTAREVDRVELWRRAGGRCAVCRRKVLQVPGHPDAGHEYSIRPRLASGEDGLVVPLDYFESHENRILLCREDLKTIGGNRSSFTAELLSDLKARHEKMIVQTGSDGTGAVVTFLTHIAFFDYGGRAYYFLKVANEGAEPVQLNRIWFATDPEVSVRNPQRPLPTRLDPGDLFETWKLVEELPHDPRLPYLARLLLDDRSVVESLPNLDVLPAGSVGGAGNPLRSLIPSVAAENHLDGNLVEKEWDVFISYAHEDGDVAASLAGALRDLGLRTWFDKFVLRVGDNLAFKLAEAINRSAFSIVILSRAFFESGWGKYEITGALNRSVVGDQVVLPIWHGITEEEARAYNPSLAGVVALDTVKASVQKMASEIHEVVTEARRLAM